MVLGVMSIMVVLAIVNGMNQTTMTWMQERGGFNRLEIKRSWTWDYRKGGKSWFEIHEVDLLKSLVPEALAVNVSVSDYQDALRYKDLSFTGESFGVLPDMPIVDEWNVQKGRFINHLDIDYSADVIVIGSSVAEELFGSRNPLGEYVNYSDKKLMVIGVMQRKYMEPMGAGRAFGENQMEYMNHRVFVPLSTMLKKLNPNLKVEAIDVKTRNPEDAKILKIRLQEAVLNLRHGKAIFEIGSAEEDLERFRSETQIFTSIFVLIAVISLFVGGIVIMNIMLASVKERTREIGVRIAVGARRFDVFVQFLVQSILITGVGGLLGVAMGFSILNLVSKFLEIAVVASVQMIWTALIVSLAVGLLFGILPAIRAANLDPVLALRED